MKRYRAKRDTKINSSTPGGFSCFYINDSQIVEFNPDDFEEVEEECRHDGYSRCRFCGENFRGIGEEEEKEIEPLEMIQGAFDSWEQQVNHDRKTINRLIRAHHILEKQVKEIKEK